MINREEIGRDIKALLEGYADSKTDVEITVRNENEADVYLNGKKFNTYLIKSKRFLRNIHKPEQQQKAFQMSIIIVRDALREKYAQYQGAELQLPATENEISDAMQRARITNSNQAYTVSECILYDENIQPKFKDLPLDIYKLNYLAKVLSEFTSYDHALFRGCIAEMNDKLTLNSLINAAYNLQDCSIIDGLSTDEQLGKIYTDNGWLEWLTGVDENIWRYIDYTALGRDIREKEKGIYTKDGYFVNTRKNYSEVYDGITFPETFADDEYMFRLLISRKPQECTESGINEQWLTLPASKERKQQFLSSIDVRSFDDCILLAVKSMESNIPMCVKDLSQLGMLNSLAHRMRDMEKSGELPKYKALLAWKGCKCLDDAVSIANNLDKYILYEEPSTIIEYARNVFADTYGKIVPDSFIKHFNFATYAEELYAEGNLVLTEYGVIKSLETKNEQITMDENQS